MSDDVEIITWYTAGDPVTQGSMRGVQNRHTGRIALVSDTGPRLGNWRAYIHYDAMQHIPEPLEGPVSLGLTFWLRRPKSTRKAETWPATRPDIDKLARAVLDALTGVAYRDDGQVAMLTAEKAWHADGRVGVTVSVARL